MKHFILFLLLGVFACGMALQAQTQSLPAVKLETLKGQAFSTETLSNDGNPIIISFWATWCKPCVEELSAISEQYEDWQAETGVRLVAISIDDARNAARVAPFVNGRSWPFEVLLDKNSEFKRAMNVVNVPHTFLLNGNNEVVYQHTSYAPGDEDELLEKVRAAGEKK